MNKLIGLTALVIACNSESEPQQHMNICEGVAQIPVEAFEVQSGDSFGNYIFNGYIRGTADYRFITPLNYSPPEGVDYGSCNPMDIETHLNIPLGIFAELNGLTLGSQDLYNDEIINRKLFHPGKIVYVIPDYEDKHGNSTKSLGDYVSLGNVGTVTVRIEPFSPAFPQSDAELLDSNLFINHNGLNLDRVTSFRPRYRTEEGVLEEPLRTFSISFKDR